MTVTASAACIPPAVSSPTAKAWVLRVLRAALMPVPTPELVALTGLGRRDVWTALVLLRRCRAVRKVRGQRVGNHVRWRAAT